MLNNYEEQYKLLNDCYEGGGGFLTGEYLEKHPRENEEKFKMRKNMAYFLNYTKPCVDAHVTPIFKKLANREWSGIGSPAWETFKDDVDLAGNDIESLMKKAADVAKLCGCSFIIMDRNKEAEVEGTLASVSHDRSQLPYAFVVDPLNVKEIKTDRFGHITLFSYYEQDEENENVRLLRTLTKDGWKLEGIGNSDRNDGDSWELGMVPVVPLASKDFNPMRPFVLSDFTSIAYTNKMIYNLCSQLTEILTDQTFSVLVFPTNEESELVIGTNNAIGIPPESSHMPTFIAPDAAPAKTLQDTIASLQQEIYRMAGVVNITGVRSQQSGVAKAWDFEQTNQVLADFADRIENAELKVAELFKKWMNVEFDYTVNYPSDYNISDIENELANAEVALNLAFGDKFNIEIFKRVITSYLPEISDEEFDDMVKDYESELEKASQDREQVIFLESEEEEGEEKEVGFKLES